MRTPIIIVALSALLLLPGCSNRPSVADGRAVIEKQIKESDGLVRLVSFRQTDGVEGAVFGVKTYRFDYAAEIEFTADCFWAGGNSVRAIRPAARTDLMTMAAYDNRRRKGDREQVASILAFHKTENGWSYFK